MTSKSKTLRFRNDYSEFRYNNDPTVQPHTSVVGGTVTRVGDEIFSGEDNPKWKSLVGRGNATNAATGVRVRKVIVGAVSTTRSQNIVQRSGAWLFDYDTGSNFSGDPQSLPPFSYPNVDSAVLNRARGQFVSEVYQLRTTLQGGVFAGVLAETIRMIRNPLGSLRKGLTEYANALKKGRRTAGKTRRKREAYVRNTWLEYQFGLAPLVHDISDGYRALQKLNNPSMNPIFRINKRASGDSVTVNQDGGGSAGSVGFACHWQQRDHYKSEVYGGYLRSTIEGHSGLADVSGAGWFNFLPTVWELVPYSFLVDYFANVGQMIESLSVASLTPVYLGESSHTERTMLCNNYSCVTFNIPMNLSPGQAHGGYQTTFAPGTNSWITERFVRTRPSYILPSFQVSLKGVIGNTRRGLNMLALLPKFRSLQPY
jgi:hypothetical protein